MIVTRASLSRLRLAPLALLLSCAAAPAPAPPAPAPAAPAPTAPAPLDPCAALSQPLASLRRLAATVALARSMPIAPVRPELFVAELDAEAARARAASSADVAARFEAIADRARALARAPQSEPGRAALLAEMERGELDALQIEQRCSGGPAALSAAALEAASGRIPAAALTRALRTAEPGTKRCLQAALKRSPGLRGAVRVRYVVGPDGAVRSAVDASLGPPDPLEWAADPAPPPVSDPAVATCVVDAFAKIAFPKPTGGSFMGTATIRLGAE